MRTGFRSALVATLLGAGVFLLTPGGQESTLAVPGSRRCVEWQAEYRRLVHPDLRGRLGGDHRAWVFRTEADGSTNAEDPMKGRPHGCPEPRSARASLRHNPAWGGQGHGWEDGREYDVSRVDPAFGIGRPGWESDR